MTFLERAPVRHVFRAVVAAPRASVFAAIADPTCWHAWFPGVRSARYATPPPHGVGTIREADVSGSRWVEEMIAWQHERRWAYTVTASSAPLAAAQVEVFDVEDATDVPGGGTRVTWTLAIEPRLVQRLAAPIAPLVMRRVFAGAMRGLEAHLAGGARAPATARPAPARGAFDADRLATRLNPLVIALLRSPLHRVLGGGLMLVTVTGRRSGRRYTIPVGYQRDGDVLHVLVSKARRKQWWRNFRTPAALEVELRGARFDAVGHVVDPRSERFVAVVEQTLHRLPMLARQLGVAWDSRTGLDAVQREVLARETALVAITRDATAR